MAIENADAMFTEVLQISVDTDQFVADLKVIETEWNNAVSRMAEQAKAAGLDPSQLLNSSAFAQDVNSIEAQVTQLSTSIGEAFGALASTLTETMSRAEQAVDRVMGKVREGTGEGAGSLSRTPYERMQLKHAEAIQEDLRLTEDAEARKQAAYEETMAVFDSAAAKQAASFQAAIEEQEAAIAQLTANEKAAAEEWSGLVMVGPEGEAGGGGRGVIGNFWAGFTASGDRSMAEMAGGVTRWLVLWQAVGAAIGVVMDALRQIPDAFKNGIQYAADLQDQAVKIQAVLADNVEFSKNIAENFQLAGQAAQFVVKQLQDVAIQDKLNPERLNSAFRALVSGGGGAMTADVQQLVKLTEMFGLAMQASGKEVMVVRSLISEIPKLIDGTITNSSKLLEVLHLNKAQWEAIREEALKHHDLVARLAPILQPYLDAVQQAQLRHSVLIDQFDLLLKREEAAFAGPLMQAYDSFLQRAIAYLEQNRLQIEAFGKIMGDVVISVGHFLADLYEAAPILKPLVVLLAGLLATFDTLLDAIGLGLEEITKGFVTLEDILRHPFDTAAWKRDIDDFDAYLKAKGADFKSGINERLSLMYELTTGKKFQSSPEGFDTVTGKPVAGAMNSDMENIASNLEAFTFRGARSPRTGLGKVGSDATDVMKEFQGQFDDLKNKADADRNAIKEAVADGQQSVINSEAEIIRSYQNEQAALQQLIEKYRERFSADTTLKPEQKKAQLQELDNLQKEFNKNVQDSISKSEEDISKEVLAQRQATYTAMLRMAKQAYDSDVNLAKDAAKNKEIYESQAVSAEIAANQKYHQFVVQRLQSEQSIFAPGTRQFSALQDQLATEEQRYTMLATQLAQQRTEALQRETLEMQKQLELASQIAARNSANQMKFDVQHGLSGPTGAVRAQYADLELNVQSKFQAYQAALEQLRQSSTKTAEEQQKAANLVAETAAQYNLAVEALQEATDSIHQLQMVIFGFDVVQSWKNAKDAVDKFSVAAQAATNVLQFAESAIGNVQRGAKQGGVLGGIGAGMAEAGQIASAFGPVGAAVGAGLEIGGAIFSEIGNIFTSEAKNIARDIRTTFNEIETAYHDSNITLVQAINQMKQERQTAIEQLSGVKGGEKQLSTLLPQIDQQIASLTQQMHQIHTQFYEKLVEIQQQVASGNQVLSQSFQNWAQVFKEAKDALGAGAKPADVQAYLNATLKQQEKDLQDQINQGEMQAIQDNLKLNDLTLQRQELLLKIHELNFSSQDSIERREAGAISQGQQLKLQREQLQNQLADLNEQITVQQHRVSVENQIYGITNDIASLHKLDAQLQERAIDEQLTQYISMKHLLESLLPLTAQIFGPNKVGFAGAGFLGTFGEGGMPGITATAPTAAPPMTIHVNFPGVPSGEGSRIGNEIGRGIYDELYYRFRSGRFIGA